MKRFDGFGSKLGLHVIKDGAVAAAIRPERVIGALTEKRNRGSVDVAEVGLGAMPYGRRRSLGEGGEHGDAVIN